MSDRDDIEKSVENEINLYDKCLDGTEIVTNKVSDVKERKNEAEAKLEFIKNAPEDLIEELSPKLFKIQLNDERKVRETVEPFYIACQDVSLMLTSSTGTSSAYVEMAHTALDLPGWTSEKFYPLIAQFDELAKEKSRKAEIQTRLEKINEDLGNMYVEAQSSVEKARSGIINVNQAAMVLRDVHQQIWGNLADFALSKYPNKWRGIQHKQLKKQPHREIVADCLTNNELDKEKILIILDNMFKLYKDISKTDFGKNPLGEDLEKLNQTYNRWFFQIDDLVNLVDFNSLKE